MANSDQEDPKPPRRSRSHRRWIAIGVAIGAGLGVATGNIGLWIGVGVAIGVAGMRIEKMRNNDND